ncbi:carboxyltransferase domain-containing protein [Nesterenkonia alba]|uniref:5-oxoprolinase subunit B/C family protein n=1 Tax=Nesterenkonia alba TaxID=515814 RepID=UPI0003B61671|nr:carboxyltransferase domain-containing protein [Nesterenkonia alba]
MRTREHPVATTLLETAAGLRAAGTRGILLEFGSLEEVMAAHQQLSRHPLTGQQDAVAAARTVLLRFVSPEARAQAATQLATTATAPYAPTEADEVTIEVVYNGEDLVPLAGELSMSPQALIDWHSRQSWRGAFGGFAPGFTYTVAEEAPRSMPRRQSPRTAVPPGSVALGGEFSAVYPRSSPGGWQLIGHTAASMWDITRTKPALVAPGDRVHYRPVREHLTTQRPPTPAPGTGGPAGEPTAAPVLRVLACGLQALIEDCGRPGYTGWGVPVSGVADAPAAGQANRLVGNAPEAAVLEIIGGITLQAEATAVLAVTGAQTQLEITDGDGATRHPQRCTPFAVLAGETLTLAPPRRGLRSVLALRGGFAAEEVLGSRSTDTLSGLGPAPLRPGDQLSAADDAVAPVTDPEPSTLPEPAEEGITVLRFTYGPRDDWFPAAEQQRLAQQRWTVSAAADRVGLRLSPDPGDPGGRGLHRTGRGELPSEGVMPGSLQVPPSGEPVVFLRDHPVTGGYPVIGVVVDEDLPAAAQLAPGDTIWLRPAEQSPTTKADV